LSIGNADRFLKRIDNGVPNLISKWDGDSQFSCRSIDVEACDNCKISMLSCRPLTCLRDTVERMPAVPGPPYWSVCAIAIQRPSRERDSVDQIVLTSLQPKGKAHSCMVVNRVCSLGRQLATRGRRPPTRRLPLCKGATPAPLHPIHSFFVCRC